MLVNGVWQGDWHPVQKKEDNGRFVRQVSSVRHWVTADGSAGPTGEGGFAAEAGRYRLYVALICPWASRTLMARKLKRLDDLVPVTVVNPVMTDQGWRFGGGFPGADDDPLHGATYMHELYSRSEPDYTGRVTVPVLWDTRTDRMVNNESADILRMFDTAFAGIAPETPSLRPAALEDEIEAFGAEIYESLNNGVYKAGFAQKQSAYDEAVAGVFETLDRLEARLSAAGAGPFILGDTLTEADIRLFVTLIRFDAAYHGVFKCNRRRIADYPALWAYMERVLDVPGIRETVDIDHIKTGYYGIKAVNPTQVVPVGPDHVTDLFRLRG